MYRRGLWLIPALSFLVLPTPAGAASPVPISPQGETASPCPTFSWSQVGGASGYELVVYELADYGAPGEAPVLRQRLPAGAGSFTPAAGDCLAPGRRYAWSLQVVGKGEESWSAPAFFGVTAAPSIAEVEAALATLRRHLAEPRLAGAGGPAERGRVGSDRPGSARDAPAAFTPLHPSRELQPLVSITAAAAAPGLGQASLTVSDQVHLDVDSAVFKGGQLFLWDDTTNLALGRGALSSNTTGVLNTASGSYALEFNTTGSANTASGFFALFNNTTGSANTASGYLALSNNTTGSNNIALGYLAGNNATTGSNNIFIGNSGSSASADNAVIRIGAGQTSTFIAGIRLVTIGASAAPVQIDASGQLGTVSCDTYEPATVCPLGTANPDGPLCNRVPVGSFCETDGECFLNGALDNCGGADWYFRTS